MRGHIRKRGKKWAVVLDVGRDEKGRRKQRWHSGYRTRREAQAGLTPAPEDADALAEAVLTMYRMPVDERVEMGARGRRYFEAHFERRMLLKRLDGWMEESQRQRGLCAS